MAEAGFDVLRRRVESLAHRHRSVTFVVLERRSQVRRWSDFGPVGLGFWDENPNGAIRRFRVINSSSLDILSRNVLDLISIQEQESPVAHRRPVAQSERNLFRII